MACLGITQEQGACPTRGQETTKGFVNPKIAPFCVKIWMRLQWQPLSPDQITLVVERDGCDELNGWLESGKFAELVEK